MHEFEMRWIKSLVSLMFSIFFYSEAQALPADEINSHTRLPFFQLENHRDRLNQRPIWGWQNAEEGQLEGPLLFPFSELDGQLFETEKSYALLFLIHPENGYSFENFHEFRSTVYAARESLEQASEGVFGHFQVAWSCSGLRDQHVNIHRGLTGMIGESKSQGRRMIFDQKMGLSVLFATFLDGDLESAAEASYRLELNTKNRNGKMQPFSWMAVEISESDCLKGLSFIDQFIEKRAFENFGFTPDPEKFEGGGCLSFAVTLADHFGVWQKLGVTKDDFSTLLSVPDRLIGYPQHSELPELTEVPEWLSQEPYLNRRVEPWQLSLPDLFIKRRKLTIVDPEKLIFFFDRLVGDLGQSTHQPRQSYGLKRDDSGRIQSAANFESIIVDENRNRSFRSLDERAKPLRMRSRAMNLRDVPGAIISDQRALLRDSHPL